MQPSTGGDNLPDSANQSPKVISTGSLRLDLALGIGGNPEGNFIEISGPRFSGETTLCQHILAEAQKQGGIGAIIDADQSFDPRFASRCGVDLNRLIIFTFSQAEPALVTLEILAKSGAINVIVLDSISSLIPNDHANGISPLLFDQDAASRLSKTLRMLANPIRKNGTIILLTNFTPTRNGVIYHALSSHTARLAIKLHASIRLRSSPISLIREKEKITGSRIRVTTIKNIFNPCRQFADLDIMYQNGILKTSEIITLGVQLSLIQVNESDYLFRDIRLGDGFQEARIFLERFPIVAGVIEQVIRQSLFGVPQG